MQDFACCDYFGTPVKFQGPDIYRIVGGIHDQAEKETVSNVSRGDLPCGERRHIYQ